MVVLLSALGVAVAVACVLAWILIGHGVALLYAAMALAVASLVLLWAGRRQAETPSPAPGRGAVTPAAPSRRSAETPPTRDRTDDEADVGFPIADYDHLWVTQITPLLVDLDVDELAAVDVRERAGRQRDAILTAVARQRTARGPHLSPVEQIGDVVAPNPSAPVVGRPTVDGSPPPAPTTPTAPRDGRRTRSRPRP